MRQGMVWVLGATLSLGCGGADDDKQTPMATPTVVMAPERPEPEESLIVDSASTDSEEQPVDPVETAEPTPTAPEPVTPEPQPTAVEEPAYLPNPNVHPTWDRAGLTCTDLGDVCPCDEEGICQLGDPSMCVPREGAGGLICSAGSAGSCEAERPYCLHQTCMTLEEAHCFCTAQPGDTSPGCEREASELFAGN